MTRTLRLALLPLATTLIPAAGAAPALDMSRVRQDIRVLASDAFEGRGPATAGEDRTVAYLIEQMRKAGLQPAGPPEADGKRGWTQDVQLRRSEFVAPPTISLSSGGQTVALTQGDGIVVRSPLSGETRFSRQDLPLVFVGYGTTAPEKNWDDFKDVDLHGKIAVVLVNDPDFETGSGDFEGKAMTYYGRWTYKFEEAARRGAAGILIVHETLPATYGWATVRNSLSNTQFDIVRAEPARSHSSIEGWMSSEVAARLFRQSGLDFQAAKAAAQRRDFRPVPLEARLSIAVQAKTDMIRSHNVMGMVKGSRAPDEALFYTAHWDHLGIGEPDAKGDRIYNGAVDNASGVAAILELARAFARGKPPQRSIVFMAVTAEEKGLLGSTFYAENPVFPLGKTVGVLNVDVPFGTGRARSFTATGPQSDLFAQLRAAGDRQGRPLVPDPNPEAGGAFRSDHFPFAKKGVPALSLQNGQDLFDGGTAAGIARGEAYVRDRYHQPADEWSPDLDLSGAPQTLELLYALGQGLANSRRWPQWPATSEFFQIRAQSAAQRK